MPSLANCNQHSNRICVTHNEKLYDITAFSSQHPGGIEVLQKHAGRDVKDPMLNTKSLSGHSHSKTAYRILQKYCIGDADDVNKNAHLQTNLEENEEDDLIDWNKPLFYQVGFLGENYDTWVHKPVNRKVRMFSNNLFEFGNISKWWMVPIYWIPIALTLIWLSYNSLAHDIDYLFTMSFLEFEGIPVNQLALPVIVIFGIFLWSLVEYVIHRWIFHGKPPVWCPWWIRLHFLFHGQHHKSPMDKLKLVFPPLPATFLSLFVFSSYCLILPFATAQALLGGSIFGYIYYDMTHYYLHHGTPTTGYYKTLKTYHMKHHFVNQSAGYGISSKLWDYPFNTLCEVDTYCKS